MPSRRFSGDPKREAAKAPPLGVAAPSRSDGSRTGGLVISLDFELYWGMRDHVSVAGYRDNLLGVRDSIPALLSMFSNRGIAATWATVGFLLFDTRSELLKSIPTCLPNYENKSLSPYPDLRQIGESEKDDPYHFGGSLVRQILATPRQELGTHTFSHYYCLEAGQDLVSFRDDLAAALRASRSKYGVDVKSIVFPRNQTNDYYLEAAAEAGIAAYRGNQPSLLYANRTHKEDAHPVLRALRLADAYLPIAQRPKEVEARKQGYPLNVTANRFLRPYASAIGLRSLERLRVHRIVKEMTAAARAHQRYHLWWHPHNFGVNLRDNLATLSTILDTYDGLRRRYGMESVTMGQAAEVVPS